MHVYASLNRSTNLGNGTTFSYRSENYGLNSTIPTTPGDYTWTIPTTTATIRVVDGDGNDIDINEVRASMNNSTTGPFGYTIPGPAGTPASISNFNTSINNPITGTYELDVLQHPTIAVSVTLTDGTTLTQTINTTTGPTNIVFDASDLSVVRNEFVDSAGRAFSYGSVQSSCAGNQFAPLVDGVFSVLAPTTACTFYASLNRSTNLGNGTTFSYRSENYGLNSTIPTTPGDYTWTIPTTTATIRVVDGDGNDIDINEVRASMNNSTTGPFGYTIPGPAGTPASISNFNTSINNPITGTYELDVLQHPTIAVSVTLTDGTTLTKTINTTTGPTNIELIAVGDPTWIVSGTGVFSDADGVDDFTESQAPNNGDGNDDGIKDAQQQNVASFPSTSPDEVVCDRPRRRLAPR